MHLVYNMGSIYYIISVISLSRTSKIYSSMLAVIKSPGASTIATPRRSVAFMDDLIIIAPVEAV